MPLSYSENATLTCPSCRNEFTSEVWMLVDAAGRPDLAQALRDGTLNVVTCPHCGYHGPAGAPLLFHDPATRRIYFAAPPDSEEHEWREQAQSLLYLLVGSLPEAERHPYLGDIQVEQEVAGLRRAVLRQRGARRAPPEGRPPRPSPAPPAHGVEHRVVEAAPPEAQVAEPSPVLDAVHALIAADSPEEFAAIIDEHPALLGEAADAVLAQLIEVAYDQGERAVAGALREARATLARMRKIGTGDQQTSRPGDGETQRSPASRPQLSDAAYQALLLVVSPDGLRMVTRDYPELQEAWADADLAARVEAALDAGDERLAHDIEERREALAALRAELGGAASLPRAITALLQADGEDELAGALAEHPILLTDAAQGALFQLAAEARQRGDDQLAEYALECRALLGKLRAGFEAG